MNRQGTRSRNLLSCTLLAACLSSCSMDGRVLVVLDEAFAAARPVLSRQLLQIPPFFPSLGSKILPFSERPASILEEIAFPGTRAAIIASPALAKALCVSGSTPNGITVIVPLWDPSQRPPQGVMALVSDPLPAYSAAGRAAGSWIAALRAENGGSPSCGIVFSPSIARPRAAFDAFATAFLIASGNAPLLARELGPSPRLDTELETYDQKAISAVQELLGADLRLLFLATGASDPAALRAATRPGLVLGVDSGELPSFDGLSFRVSLNMESFAETARRLALASLKAGTGNGKSGLSDQTESQIRISALLIAENAAWGIKTAGKSFASFIEESKIEH